jgi:hypothetical protein
VKKRSPVAVLLLPLITLGIYSLYWEVVTKIEMNNKGASIPTAWLIIVPIVNIWWIWKHSEGVEKVTGEKMSAVIAFILQFLLGFIGQAIIQDSLNKVADQPAVASAPAEPNAPDSTPSS